MLRRVALCTDLRQGLFVFLRPIAELAGPELSADTQHVREHIVNLDQAFPVWDRKCSDWEPELADAIRCSLDPFTHSFVADVAIAAARQPLTKLSVAACHLLVEPRQVFGHLFRIRAVDVRVQITWICPAHARAAEPKVDVDVEAGHGARFVDDRGPGPKALFVDMKGLGCA